MQYSSDNKGFGLDHVNKLVSSQRKKNLSLQSLDDQMSEMTPNSEQDFNESTNDSKKAMNSTASSTEQKSEINGQNCEALESECSNMERYPVCQSFDTYNIHNPGFFRFVNE